MITSSINIPRKAYEEGYVRKYNPKQYDIYEKPQG